MADKKKAAKTKAPHKSPKQAKPKEDKSHEEGLKSAPTEAAPALAARNAPAGKASKKKVKPAKSEPTGAKAAKPKASKPKAPKPKAPKPKAPKLEVPQTATLISSETVFQGPLFRVQHDKLIDPTGKPSERDVIRHNGSVVILAVDPAKSKKNPWVVIERQYRHAANQFLWELPAGKLEAGEDPLAGAMRELAEETGYGAKKWSPLVEYFASPGFLGEAMKVFLAEGLIAGDAHPEEDEDIDFRLVKLADLLEMIDRGDIRDGKTLSAVLLYARRLGVKRRK